MSLNDYERDDPNFVKDLKESDLAVWLVAKWLHRLGRNVAIRPLKVRASIEEMGEYGDCGDIEVIQRIEVKRRSLDFSSSKDYPFATVIVDVAHTWDRATPKPFAYVILNSSMTYAAIVLGESFKKWMKVERMDKSKHRMRTFYECPLSCAKFFKVG